ncbi:hypothetical protein ACKC9G_12340 [Pokkaliibacter sp. CJK22405]|uniref:hypothetical protein n=1 Tax=Pokkaliibacter sp. CJK22405 TaxID=3384615 RepID=UPI0039852A0D
MYLLTFLLLVGKGIMVRQLVAGITVIAFGTGVAFYFLNQQSTEVHENFNPEAWHSHIPSRAPMIYTLTHQYDLTAMSQAQIIELLGQPDGYYERDEFPAYRLRLGRDCVFAISTDQSTGLADGWQVAPRGCLRQKKSQKQ